MKGILKTIALALILSPLFVYAVPVSWDYTSSILTPLRSMWGSEVRVPYITATSTSATSTLPWLTSTNLKVTGKFYAGGSPGTSGYVLQTTGTGVQWAATNTLGFVDTDTTYTGGDGLTLTGTDFDCDTASGTVFGCLSAANWTTFNNKQDTITAGDALTLTGTDIDFDGGATPSGDLGGTWASPSVSDDSHAHTGTTLSGIDISSDTNLAGDTEVVLTGDALSLGTDLTFTNATATNFAIATGFNLFGGGYKTTANALCIQLTGSADLCDGGDASGAGGSGISTSTTPNISDLAYWTSASSLGTVATGTLSESVTGLELSASRYLIGGAAALSLTSGYEIPLTASTSQWAKAYASTTALSATAPLAYAQTGAFSITQSTASADGYLSSTHWNLFNNKVSSTSIDTCAEFAALMGSETGTCGSLVLSADPVLTGTLSFENASGTAASSTNMYGSLGRFLNLIVNTLATFLNVTITGLLDLGAGVLEIPNGTGPTVDSVGELALDTTSNQLVLYGSEKKVIGNGNFYPAFTYATSTAWAGTTTIPLGTAYVAETWNGVQCFTDAGTLNVSFTDGTNRMNAMNASTTVGTVTLSTNNTFTASEKRYVEIGTPASSPTKISCTVSKSITAD